MRLESLYHGRDVKVLNEFLTRLRGALRKSQVISEGKKVIVTTEIFL
jgi:chorismate-pyruvate lyase